MTTKQMLDNMKLSIDAESVNIYIETGEDNDPIHVVYWHIDEVVEDASVALSIATAIEKYYESPQDLLKFVTTYNQTY